LEERTNSCEVGLATCLSLRELFVAVKKLIQYYTVYLASGIEYNYRSFQQTVSSFGGVSTNEYTDDLAVEVDNSNTGDEDFS